MAIAVSGSAALRASSSQQAAAPASLAFVSAIHAARAIREGTVSSRELTQYMFDRIERYKSLNAVVTLMREEALARAGAADAARAKGQSWGPLHGVPCTIKDAFETRGARTTAGVMALKDHVPTADAAVVERVRAAGAVLLGMTNVPPMLSDYQSNNPIFGRTNNPWDPSRTPGGSTGGGAAALAAGLGYLAIGSDIAGSIRIPAHFCGVYGHKPSHGVVPERGHIPPLPGARPSPPTGLSVAGPLARTPEDLKLALQILAGPDLDTSIAYKWNLPPARKKNLKEYRIGYVIDDRFCPVASDVKPVLGRTIDALRKGGVTLREGWPAGVDPLDQWQTYMYLLFAGVAANAIPDEQIPQLREMAAHSDRSRDTILAQAVTAPHKTFLEMQRKQLQARDAWQHFFREHDAFIMPAAFVAAFPHDNQPNRLATPEGDRPYEDLEAWIAAPTLAGLPVTVAPVGRTGSGLPVGVQIVGPFLEDATTIDIASHMAPLIGGFIPPPGY